MNAAKSTLFGLILAVVAAAVLFWNEGRAVKTYLALLEGAGIVVSVDAAKPDPANDGKLIHIAGKLVPSDVPTDKTFNIGAPGALRLARKVEMYQWQEIEKEEKRKTSDGKEETIKSYVYELGWSDNPVDSSKFKNADAPKNPSMPFVGEKSTVSAATIGGFELAGSDVSYLGSNVPVTLTSDDWLNFKKGFTGAKPVWFRDNALHVSLIYGKPVLGDLRISYTRGGADQASVAGKQTGTKIGPYLTSGGRNLLLVREGVTTAAQMFDEAQSANTVMTWILRVVGLLVMFIGFKLAFSILTAIGDAIPFVGNMVRAGTSLVAFAMTMLFGALAIGIGWIFYRPLLGFGILAAGVLAMIAVSFMGRGKPAPAPQAQRA
jgi:hypothetical protein